MTITLPRAIAHLVIGKYRCLHIFTMATVLKRGEDIPLNFAPRTILTLKPTRVSRAPSHFGPFDLNYESKFILDSFISVCLQPKN